MTFVFCAISLYYFQTQPRCLFPRLVDQFVLPLPNSKKPVAPLVMQCIKAHLHQVFGSKYSSNSQFSTERNLRFHWFFFPTVIGQENSQTIKYNLDWVSLSCAWVPMVGHVRYFKHSQFIIVFFFSQFLQGLACLDFKRDEFIRRKIKQIFISYFRLFNQVRATFIQPKEPAKESLFAQAREKLLSIAVIILLTSQFSNLRGPLWLLQQPTRTSMV